MTSDAILIVSQLRKEYRIGSRTSAKRLTAVDGIGFEVRRGETVALVGESGSGKSTVARCVTRLVEPTSGEVWLDGVTVTSMRRTQLAMAYGDIQMVFQDPSSSLNPRMTVRATLDEPLRLHSNQSRSERERRIIGLLESVKLSEDFLDRFPWQLSGGQRQRIGIARALAVDPKIILLDEPTASLDVSVRGQVIELLAEIQREKGLAYLFISHDLGVVQKIADRVLVMYLGGIVESGPTAEVFGNPTHPYTRALLSAAPVAEYGRIKHRFILKGEIPSPVDLPPGCRLAGRCPLVMPECMGAVPPLLSVSASHFAACPVVLADNNPDGPGAAPSSDLLSISPHPHVS
jgi:peptide/nickel transport system ATP-binding protein/oligopeptide transport system ATP-binding protein